MHRPMLIAIVALGLAACATGGAATAGSRARGSGDVLTAEEIAKRPGITNAYDAVHMLRPSFLHSRGQTSLHDASTTGDLQPLPTVFVDNQQFGEVASLREIPVTDVQEIRYISASDATTRWGTGYPNGVIQVVRKTQ